MKVLFLIPSITRCGPTNVAFNIITYLKKNGVEIFLCYFWLGENPDVDFVNQNSRSHYYIGGSIFSSLIKFLFLIYKLKPDICHSHGLIFDFFSYFSSIIFRKTKFVSTLHCNIDEDYDTTYFARPLKGSIYKRLHKFTLKHLYMVFPVSNSASKSVINANKFVIYNGVVQKKIVKSNSQLANLVFTGRLIERKNVKFILDNIDSYVGEIQVTIVGNGPLYDDLKLQAKYLKNITFVGYQAAPEVFYDMSTILVNPSLSEGLPMAVIEALSCGIPCLLSNIPSHNEIKSRIKLGVELFDFDRSDFIKKLEKIIQINQNTSFNIKQQWFLNFSIESMGSSYLSSYNKILIDEKSQ